MTQFRLQELHALESGTNSPGALRSKIGEMILKSTVCRAKVEAINPDTGEYRVVLQGTLDREEPPWK
jgi:hypothetical protein